LLIAPVFSLDVFSLREAVPIVRIKSDGMPGSKAR
jgi:hypothetical protein